MAPRGRTALLYIAMLSTTSVFASTRRITGAQVTAFTSCASRRLSSSRAPTPPAPRSTQRGFGCTQRPQRASFFSPDALAHFAIHPSSSRFAPGMQLFSSMTANGASKSSEAEEEFDWDTLLPFEKHSHNSIKIAVPETDSGEADPYDASTFHSKLEATLATAQQLSKTAAWITVPMSRARLIEEASKSGFEFHHAEGSVATLNKWLLEGQESRVPTYATHQVGVGAVVINEKDEILCVREKRNNYRPWKVPGGLAELGEDLDSAVVREVHEETGIKCEFMSVLGVRHVHGSQFGRSDLFFVCRLQPIPDEGGKIASPTPQEGEIEAVAWLPLKEYREMVNSDDPKVGHPMMKQMISVLDQGLDNDIQRMMVTSVVPGRRPSPVYHAPIRPDSSD